MKPGCDSTTKTSNPSLLRPMHGAWKTIAKPAWFLQNKYSIIYGKAFTKIILHTQSLWSTCVACNKKGNAYIESMLTLRTCHASRMISAKKIIDHSWNTVYKDYSTFSVSNLHALRPKYKKGNALARLIEITRKELALAIPILRHIDRFAKPHNCRHRWMLPAT